MCRYGYSVVLLSVVLLFHVASSVVVFFFQAEDGIRDLVRSRGLGDVYKRQGLGDGLEFGFELPFAHTSGGFLDRFLIDYHDALGLPDQGLSLIHI